MNDLTDLTDYTFKDFLFEDFELYPKDYYYEFFALQNVVDNIIESIFSHNSGYTYTFHFDNWNKKRWGIIVYNTVINRLAVEHNIVNKELYFNDRYRFSSQLDFNNYKMHFSYADNFNPMNYDDGRRTGRTTRLANQIIQDLYHNGIVYGQDHFHDWSKGTCRGMRGYQSMPDRMLFDKVKMRICEEFPSHILNMVTFDNANLVIKFDLDKIEGIYKINYKKFEI